VKNKERTGFGAKLKAIREAKGLTQQQLAETAGMNRYGLAKLEQGVTEPYWPTVLKLANALGVTCEAFGGGAASEAAPRVEKTVDETEQPKPKRTGQSGRKK
jgi:transcriptional regulator with XRE-family HTH domain